MKIRLDQDTRRGRALLWLAGQLVRGILGILGRTWRLRIVEGQDHHDRLLAEPRPYLLGFWHNRLVIAAVYLLRRCHLQGIDLAILASQSRDAELVVGLANAWKVRVLRGSATRGGRQAMWGLYKALQAGASPAVMLDGPTGPIYQVKPGLLFLAQATGTPIQPFGFAADRAWRIRSWDRLIIPKPFARVAVVLGEPQRVDESLDDEGRRLRAVQLGQRLDELTRRAEAAVGGPLPNAPSAS